MPISPVNRLPAELLLQAFRFYLETVPDTCDVYRHIKRELASVSRRWRDVILHSPSLWTTIKVTSYWSEARAKTYVTRSSQSLLDIDFWYWSEPDSDGIFTAVLNVLTSCTHRWRSFTIQEDITGLHRSIVLDKLEHLSFPSLKRVSIGNFPGSLTEQWELWLRPENSPHLEHVHLYVEADTLVASHIPSGISALSLEITDYRHIRDSSVFESLSYRGLNRGLTSLHVSGMSVDFDLHPNSIQLPLLEEFVCTIDHGKALIHALVAPKLKHFDYSPQLRPWGNSPSVIFADLNSKFNNVDYLCLSHFTAENLSEAVCLASPNVCQLELVDVPYWKNLKRLTMKGLEHSDLGVS
ncbi:hypothetical protein EDC04DRAFT_2626527 [Pisolithus marmoratus]|nr:hypothetical protein EDC04DRAFT_2626527 [Pisolithus marmoratus]